ncbi:exodeoxyribonuclease V alpha subunit [Filimonas zeae]|uniref:exodeoxyribonuclease V subunit alpha n=1 Tax=Filimonas zeae TaxID=1737353 RepID=UPI001E61D441|nr:exodeoxyribonuclease V subunit alpha [Filimonas zeae]MDR6337641.1 exodeoxyribonuclease V alpha subunit [Filimonas zeae]
MPYTATINDVHQQFAEYFNVPVLKPYLYQLFKKMAEGHICIHLDDAGGDTALPPLQLPVPLVTTEEDGYEPFVLHGNRLYMHRYFRYETLFLRRIFRFMEEDAGVREERLAMLDAHRTFISALFEQPAIDGPSVPDWQLAAAITGVLNQFTIITGGPGTGKTTTVAKILAILYTLQPGTTVALAAPTGKAAARMAESLRNTRLPAAPEITGLFAAITPATIHRLLKPQPNTPYFRHNAANPLPYDVVIVDECSMIDVALFAKLLDAIGTGTRLLLLGDKDQLASVEAGSLFGDVCQAQPVLNLFTPERLQYINTFIAQSGKQLPASAIGNDTGHPLFQHLVELRYSHRFSDDKGIGKFSKAVIQNQPENIRPFFQPGYDEQVVIDQLYSQQVFENFIAGYEDFLQEKDIRTALRKMNQLRVLCAVREGESGLYAVNLAIEKYLHSRKLITAHQEFYENRPVILTRNYYEHNLFNGDTGIIRADENNILMAWFEDSEGELRAVLPGYLTEAETVFAMTIHKSQGSEFNQVLVILPPSSDVAIVTRELLYTAVSRAKSKVYIQATEEVVLQAAARFVERASGIAARFHH